MSKIRTVQLLIISVILAVAIIVTSLLLWKRQTVGPLKSKAATTRSITDDFNGTTINNNVWTIVNSACNPTITQNNGVAQISMPAATFDCGAGLQMTNMLSGDFSVEIDVPTIS